jgi:monovalent cation:H+ antiporter-2, CPA2 family
MVSHLSLISTIAMGMGLALFFGFWAFKLRLPPLVGYLLAGIVVGPFSPGFVADAEISHQLSEIGIMLLMFGVGLHFSLKDLMSVKHIAIPGALAQIAVATGIGMGVAKLWGWGLGEGVVFGLSLSVASTVVLIKALESRGILESMNGRIAVGWLIVEDLVLVLVLVLLPPFAMLMGGQVPSEIATGQNVWVSLGLTLGKVAIFIVLMLVLGRRVFPWLLWQVAKTGSRELFTLCVVAAAIGIAYGAGLLFGVSFALGAFFAGMVLRESSLSYRAAEETLPLRDAFSVLFFVSAGMLFNPMILVQAPFKVFLVVAVIMIGKSIAAFIIVLVFRYPVHTALTVSASLAQIGEFSFILVGLGNTFGLLSDQGQSLILAAALISIALNPLAFAAIKPLQAWLGDHRLLTRSLGKNRDPLSQLPESVESKQVTDHVILVGYGRVGQYVFEALTQAGISLVVVEQNRESVEALREKGVKSVAGSASEPEVLVQAHVARARVLIVCIPEMFHIRKIIEIAKTLNPRLEIIGHAESQDDARLLKDEKIARVFMGEEELARSMVQHILGGLSPHQH